MNLFTLFLTYIFVTVTADIEVGSDFLIYRNELRTYFENIVNSVTTSEGTNSETKITITVNNGEVLDLLASNGLRLNKRIDMNNYDMNLTASTAQDTDSLTWNITLGDDIRPVVYEGSMIGFVDISDIDTVHKRSTADWISGGIAVISGGYIVLKAGVEAVHSKSLARTLTAARNAALDEAAFLGDMAFTVSVHFRYGPNNRWWGAVTSEGAGDLEAGESSTPTLLMMRLTKGRKAIVT